MNLRDGDDYKVFRMRDRRGDDPRPPLEVHFKAGPRPRNLGLNRVAR